MIMQNRRSFIQKFSGISLGTLSFPLFSKNAGQAPVEAKFFHHVFFWLRNPDDDKDRKIFEAALKELGTIENIKFLHIGKPADTARPVIDNTYHYSFLAGFEDKSAHDIYQEHPVHDKFRNEYGYLWERVLVYDAVDL